MNLQVITTYMKGQLPEAPQTAIILGSGLGKFVTSMENRVAISYADLNKHELDEVKPRYVTFVDFGHSKLIAYIHSVQERWLNY